MSEVKAIKLKVYSKCSDPKEIISELHAAGIDTTHKDFYLGTSKDKRVVEIYLPEVISNYLAILGQFGVVVG